MEIISGDKTLYIDIIELFFQDAPVQIRSLNEAVNKRDAPLIHRQAHTIKGSSANVGAMALREVSFQMETAGRESDFTQVEELMEMINAEFARFKEAIDT